MIFIPLRTRPFKLDINNMNSKIVNNHTCLTCNYIASCDNIYVPFIFPVIIAKYRPLHVLQFLCLIPPTPPYSQYKSVWNISTIESTALQTPKNAGVSMFLDNNSKVQMLSFAYSLHFSFNHFQGKR